MNGSLGRDAPWLSKSRFVIGKQCVRQLWWRVHEPDAPELVPDADLARRFEVGTEVGALARTYVPGGVLITPDHGAYDERLAATRAALHAGAPVLYEAAFFADGVFVAVDILERTGSGFRVAEVKSTTAVEAHHLWDVAVQVHVLRRAGLRVEGADVMHLDRRCAAPDLSNLFRREDVTGRIEELLPLVPAEIARMHAVLASSLPVIASGPHCGRPYTCPFTDRCGARRDGAHVRSLYRIGAIGEQLESEGVVRIVDIPDDRELPVIAERQRRATKEQRIIVEPTLGAALAGWSLPIAFLDFETIAPAIPVWPGTHPYDTIPVQFSVDLVRAAEASEHFEYLAAPLEDPRRALAEALLSATSRAATIVAYNAPFERRVITELAVALPDLRNELDALASRVVDLLPVVRDHVAHPAFEGHFGLKIVTRALGISVYEALEVRDGAAATRLLEALLTVPERIPDISAARAAALAYCAADTYAARQLWQTLLRLFEISR